MDWDQVYADTKNWENDVPFMYLDTNGHVTVAVGKLIPNTQAAQRLGFVNRLSGAKATATEIGQDYASVVTQESGHTALYYKKFTALDLPSAQRMALLHQDVAEADAQLARRFRNYMSYPVNARRALIDMCFNIGSGNFAHFPKMNAACEAGDWHGAASECRRSGISPERNEWTRALFLSC